MPTSAARPAGTAEGATGAGTEGVTDEDEAAAALMLRAKEECSREGAKREEEATEAT